MDLPLPLRVAALLFAAAMLLPARAAANPAVDVPTESASGFDLGRADIQQFIAEVVERHGFTRDQVRSWLALGVRQPRVLDAISRPAERVTPWWQYRANFLTERRIDEGVQFWEQHREKLDRTEADTGVSAAHIVAIIGVETFYGRITGRWRVLDALMTLAFDYPPRGPFFRSELEQFLVLAREEGLDPATALGSYAGAMGAPQFMPSSYRRFAVDGSADRKRDLFNDWDDVIGSVANYLKVHGWRRGEPVLVDAATDDPRLMATLDPRNLELRDTVGALRARGIRFATDVPAATPAILLPAELEDRPNVRVGFRNFHVITRYNRSIRYAMAVHDLAETLSERVLAAESIGAEAGGVGATGS